MAKVEKNKVDKKKKLQNSQEESNIKVREKNDSKKTDKKRSNGEKKSLITRFRIFCHGVKSEFDRVHWPSKNDMVKYSIATIIFVIFFAVFFYLIDIIFALVQSLFS